MNYSGGGTWTQIKDTFLLTAGDTYTAGETGGEATHTLTTSEMPSHTHGMAHRHQVNNHTHTESINGYVVASSSIAGDYYGLAAFGTSNPKSTGGSAPYTGNAITTGGTTARTSTDSTGSGTAHNNMPPYKVVYAWERTA